MNRLNFSIFVFGLYAMLMGFTLLFISNVILPIFNIPITNKSWIYFLGFVLMCSSYYYLRSSLAGNVDFARYTIHTRFASLLIVTVLVLPGKVDFYFLSFGAIDGVGGL